MANTSVYRGQMKNAKEEKKRHRTSINQKEFGKETKEETPLPDTWFPSKKEWGKKWTLKKPKVRGGRLVG